MFDRISGLRKRATSVAAALPKIQRRRRPHLAVVTAPFVALAGVAAMAGLLFWDERRRAAMRKRLEAVAGSVSSSVSASKNRVAPAKTPTGVGKD